MRICKCTFTMEIETNVVVKKFTAFVHCSYAEIMLKTAKETTVNNLTSKTVDKALFTNVVKKVCRRAVMSKLTWAKDGTCKLHFEPSMCGVTWMCRLFLVLSLT